MRGSTVNHCLGSYYEYLIKKYWDDWYFENVGGKID